MPLKKAVLHSMNECLVDINKNLIKLRTSQLQRLPEFSFMYKASAAHYKEAKIANVTVQSNETLNGLLKNTHFYNLLTQMLLEIDSKLAYSDTWEEQLQKVVEWFVESKEKLVIKPTFKARAEIPTPQIVTMRFPSPRRPKTGNRVIIKEEKNIIFPSQRCNDPDNVKVVEEAEALESDLGNAIGDDHLKKTPLVDSLTNLDVNRVDEHDPDLKQELIPELKDSSDGLSNLLASEASSEILFGGSESDFDAGSLAESVAMDDKKASVNSGGSNTQPVSTSSQAVENNASKPRPKSSSSIQSYTVNELSHDKIPNVSPSNSKPDVNDNVKTPSLQKSASQLSFKAETSPPQTSKSPPHTSKSASPTVPIKSDSPLGRTSQLSFEAKIPLPQTSKSPPHTSKSASPTVPAKSDSPLGRTSPLSFDAKTPLPQTSPHTSESPSPTVPPKSDSPSARISPGNQPVISPAPSVELLSQRPSSPTIPTQVSSSPVVEEPSNAVPTDSLVQPGETRRSSTSLPPPVYPVYAFVTPFGRGYQEMCSNMADDGPLTRPQGYHHGYSAHGNYSLSPATSAQYAPQNIKLWNDKMEGQLRYKIAKAELSRSNTLNDLKSTEKVYRQVLQQAGPRKPLPQPGSALLRCNTDEFLRLSEQFYPRRTISASPRLTQDGFSTRTPSVLAPSSTGRSSRLGEEPLELMDMMCNLDHVAHQIKQTQSKAISETRFDTLDNVGTPLIPTRSGPPMNLSYARSEPASYASPSASLSHALLSQNRDTSVDWRGRISADVAPPSSFADFKSQKGSKTPFSKHSYVKSSLRNQRLSTRHSAKMRPMSIGSTDAPVPLIADSTNQSPLSIARGVEGPIDERLAGMMQVVHLGGAEQSNDDFDHGMSELEYQIYWYEEHLNTLKQRVPHAKSYMSEPTQYMCLSQSAKEGTSQAYSGLSREYTSTTADEFFHSPRHFPSRISSAIPQLTRVQSSIKDEEEVTSQTAFQTEVKSVTELKEQELETERTTKPDEAVSGEIKNQSDAKRKDTGTGLFTEHRGPFAELPEKLDLPTFTPTPIGILKKRPMTSCEARTRYPVQRSAPSVPTLQRGLSRVEVTPPPKPHMLSARRRQKTDPCIIVERPRALSPRPSTVCPPAASIGDSLAVQGQAFDVLPWNRPPAEEPTIPQGPPVTPAFLDSQPLLMTSPSPTPDVSPGYVTIVSGTSPSSRPVSSRLSRKYVPEKVEKRPLSRQTSSPRMLIISKKAGVATITTAKEAPKQNTILGVRPIPTDQVVKDPFVEQKAADTLRKAAAAVDIPKYFRGDFSQDFVLKLDAREIEKREEQQKAAVRIQRNYRQHLARIRRVRREVPPTHQESLEWTREYKKILAEKEKDRQTKMLDEKIELQNANRDEQNKISVIGPHVEVYKSFHQPRTGPSARILHCSAVVLQKNYRGYKVRKLLDKLSRKASFLSPNLPSFLRHYFTQMRQIQRKAGVHRPKTRFDLNEIIDFMEKRRIYELGFDSLAFQDTLQEEDIPAFFRACELCPSPMEINDTLELLFNRPDRLQYNLSKEEAVELVFQIYKPPGSGLENTRKSTWMHPIIDGEDAIQGVCTSELEPTPLSVCFKLVVDARRDRLGWDVQMAANRQIRDLVQKERKMAQGNGNTEAEEDEGNENH